MTPRKLKKIEDRLKDFQKHYPDNKYKIDDKYQIILVSGRKAHKIKELKK